MSYDIIYNKQFVKLRKTKEVIPMLLAGPSNCFEIGHNGRNGRRTRSWDSMRYYNRKGKLSEKPEVILKKLDAEINRIIRKHRIGTEYSEPVAPKEIKKHYGYYVAIVVGSGHCADTSWDSYRGVFANGIKKAITIEELANLGIHPYLSYWEYEESHNGKPESVDIKTEGQYFAELRKWRDWSTKTGHLPGLSFRPSDTDAVLRKLRVANRKAPRERCRVEQDHYFVLHNQNGNLRRYTSRGYRYSMSETGGHQFRTEAEAEKRRLELVKKERHQADTWRVKRIDRPTWFNVTGKERT